MWHVSTPYSRGWTAKRPLAQSPVNYLNPNPKRNDTKHFTKMLPNIATGERKNINPAFADPALVMDKLHFTWSNI